MSSNIKQWEELDDSWKCFFDISPSRYHISKIVELYSKNGQPLVNIDGPYFRKYCPNALLCGNYDYFNVIIPVFKSLLIHLSTKVSYLEPNLLTIYSKIFMR